MLDAIIIGAGLSGLAAAIRLAQAGQQTAVITKGLGGLQLSQGTVDILGYNPDRVERPMAAVTELAAANVAHPYAVIGPDAVAAGVAYLVDLVGPDLLTGQVGVNLNLPTAVGAIRPTALAQPSMLAGDVTAGRPMAIVGPNQLKDFYPELCAANLSRTPAPGGGTIVARPYRIDMPARPGEVDSSALNYARAHDDDGYRRNFAAAVTGVIGDEPVVGLPAVLGLRDLTAWRRLAELIGRDVFEIPLAPPSVPGLRLNQALTARARAAGVRFINGSHVIAGQVAAAGGGLDAVTVAVAGRQQDYPATWFVYAAGGFESGALTMASDGQISETVFDLPLCHDDHHQMLTGEFWADQALFKVGLRVDSDMRVIDGTGQVVYANLFAAGSILAGATRWSEKSGEGIALGSAIKAADAILEGSKS